MSVANIVKCLVEIKDLNAAVHGGEVCRKTILYLRLLYKLRMQEISNDVVNRQITLIKLTDFATFLLISQIVF